MGNSCDCNENNELEIFCNDLERRLESNNTINSKILSSYQEISQTKKLEKTKNYPSQYVRRQEHSILLCLGFFPLFIWRNIVL